MKLSSGIQASSRRGRIDTAHEHWLLRTTYQSLMGMCTFVSQTAALFCASHEVCNLET